ncbi:MAG: choice-of-anchor Q domain-containing protein [Paludibacter sp.]
MKKITLFVALLCSISAFSTRYLIETTGSRTWRAAGAGEVKVSVPSFDYWYGSATLNSGDQIWIAGGTYLTGGTVTLKGGISIYGGFAGTETAITQRSQVTGGKLWEFTYPTIMDAANQNYQGFITSAITSPTYIDGITITKNSITDATANVTGVGITLLANWVMQNCIVKANTFTNSGLSQCRGAGVYVKGGQVLNSYIYNNSATKGTGTGSTYGGGVAFSYSETPVTTVKGCTIESNVSTVTGGGMALLDGTGGIIEDCIIKSNSSVAGGGGGIGVSNMTAVGSSLSIKNCQFIENTALAGNGGGATLSLSEIAPTTIAIESCSFIGNTSFTVGGALDIQTGTYSGIKNCIFRDNQNTTTLNGANATSALFCGTTNLTVQNSVFTNNSTTANTSQNNTVLFIKAGCQLLNCTFANNANPGTLGYLLNFSGKVGDLTNCLIWGNTGQGGFKGFSSGVAATYNATDNYDIFGLTYSNNIKTLTVSPNNCFVNPTTFVGVPTDATTKAASAAANWQLLGNSPAVNAGTDLSAIGITTDILGTSRPFGSAYDIGAYECTSTGLNDVRFNFDCFSANQRIELRGLSVGQVISIYSVIGKLISTQVATDSNVSIASKKGIFLVRVAGTANKVIVQ